MRRKKQQLGEEETVQLLQQGHTGVLGLQGDDGYPYTIPLNYVYDRGRLFFHGARKGHKIDSVRRCDKASFCLIAEDRLIPEKLTDAYRSVIAFGRIRELRDPAERDAAARLLGLSILDDPESVEASIRSSQASLACFEFEIEHMTGKQWMEPSEE